MKKLSLFLLSVASAVCIIFSACGQIETPSDGSDSTPPPSPTPETSITFSEFIQNYKNKAVEYYNDNFSVITSGKQLLGKKISIGANANDELNTLTAVYTYKVDDTHRKIEKVKATLSSPVDLDKIVNGTAGSATYTHQTEVVFAFDIKEIDENSELCEKLFATANLSSDVKIYSEVESEYSNARDFQLLTYDSAAYTVGEISVIVDDDFSQEKLFENMQKPSKVEDYAVVKTCAFKEEGQETIISSDYDFASDSYTHTPVEPENPDQGGEGESGEGGGETEEKIGGIAELIENYNDEVYAALNENLLPTAGRQIYGRRFDIDKIVEVKWDLGNSNLISEIKLISTYKQSATSSIFNISNIELEALVKIEDFKTKNIADQIRKLFKISSISQFYEFVYIIDSMQGRNELYEAIFAACGYELTEGSTRLFYDIGCATDGFGGIGEAHEFKVTEITDTGVQEFTVRIRESSDDSGYIANIEKQGNFAILNQKSLTLSGNFITQPEN